MKNWFSRHIFKLNAAIILAVGLVLIYTMFKSVETQSFTSISQESYPVITVETNNYLFDQSLAQAGEKYIHNGQRVMGAILPHHDLASDLLADFFLSLSKNQIVDTFVILAPNHRDLAKAPAISAAVNWQTFLGEVKQDQEILDQLVKDDFIAYDLDNFKPEHSVAVLLPFIKQYFPQAKVAPIIFTSHQTNDKSFSLAAAILPWLDERTVVINSLDLSHYLPLSQAERNDQITLSAIKNKDYQLLSNLNSDYLDSPDSLNALLKIMELSQAQDLQIIEHSNSAKILKADLNQTTSYLSAYFTAN